MNWICLSQGLTGTRLTVGQGELAARSREEEQWGWGAGCPQYRDMTSCYTLLYLQQSDPDWRRFHGSWGVKPPAAALLLELSAAFHKPLLQAIMDPDNQQGDFKPNLIPYGKPGQSKVDALTTDAVAQEMHIMASWLFSNGSQFQAISSPATNWGKKIKIK